MSRDDYYGDDRPRRRRRDDYEDDYDDGIARRGEESIGLSVASMVLGIISAVIFCFWPISMPLAILAIIFGAIGMNKGGKGMGIAGMICGIAAIALFLIFLLIGLTAGPTWQPRQFWWRA
jgi:hypothetical protein